MSGSSAECLTISECVKASSKFCGRDVIKVCKHANESWGKIPTSFDAVNELQLFEITLRISANSVHWDIILELALIRYLLQNKLLFLIFSPGQLFFSYNLIRNTLSKSCNLRYTILFVVIIFLHDFFFFYEETFLLLIA